MTVRNRNIEAGTIELDRLAAAGTANQVIARNAGNTAWVMATQGVPGPGSITVTELADNALAATAAGRAKMQDAFFNEATVTAKFGAASIADDRLKSTFPNYPGLAGVGYVYISGLVADTNTVTINARVYEFDTNGAITGNVTVNVAADQTASAAITALVAAINADASRVVDAINLGGDLCGLVARTAGTGGNYTLAVVGANISRSGANLTGGDAAGSLSLILSVARYTITAQDVTSLASVSSAEIVIGGSPSTTAPTVLFWHLTDINGFAKTIATSRIRVAQANTNFYEVILRDDSAMLQAGDTLSYGLVI